MVSIKVGGKGSGNSCGGEYQVEWIVEGGGCWGHVPFATADSRDGLSPSSSDVTEE
jgi:hypothetical protein